MTGQRWVCTLRLGNEGLPLRLTGKGGEAEHVAVEVKVVDGVHDHEDVGAAAEDLHVKYSDLFLAFHNLGPDVLVNIAEEPNNIQFVQQFSGLADDYNGRSHMGRTISLLKLRIYVLIHLIIFSPDSRGRSQLIIFIAPFSPLQTSVNKKGFALAKP